MIVFLLFFIISIYITLVRVEYAISMILFFIPYSKFDLAKFGANYALLFGLLIGLLLRKAIKSNNKFHEWKKYREIFLLLIPFIISLVFSFLPFSFNDVEFAARDNYWKSFFIFSFSYVGAFLFLIILLEFMKDKKTFNNFLLSFISSVFLLLIPWLSFKFNLKVPSFLQRKISLGDAFYGGIGSDLRFAGFWGDYELTNELCFIIFVLSIVLFLNSERKKIKYYSVVSGIVALTIALSTGTRSIILMLTIFSVIIATIYFFKSKMNFVQKLGTLVLITIGVLIAYDLILQNVVLVERFNETIAIFKSSRDLFNIQTLELLANRQYSTTYLDILEVGNIVGIGPLAVTGIRGSRMVYHCLYYNIVIVFGVVGLIFFILFWKKLIGKLWEKINFNNDTIAIILFSLLIAILIDQMKINYLRTNSHILTWNFLYSIILVYTNRNFYKNRGKNV